MAADGGHPAASAQRGGRGAPGRRPTAPPGRARGAAAAGRRAPVRAGARRRADPGPGRERRCRPRPAVDAGAGGPGGPGSPGWPGGRCDPGVRGCSRRGRHRCCPRCLRRVGGRGTGPGDGARISVGARRDTRSGRGVRTEYGGAGLPRRTATAMGDRPGTRPGRARGPGRTGRRGRRRGHEGGSAAGRGPARQSRGSGHRALVAHGCLGTNPGARKDGCRRRGRSPAAGLLHPRGRHPPPGDRQTHGRRGARPGRGPLARARRRGRHPGRGARQDPVQLRFPARGRHPPHAVPRSRRRARHQGCRHQAGPGRQARHRGRPGRRGRGGAPYWGCTTAATPCRCGSMSSPPPCR